MVKVWQSISENNNLKEQNKDAVAELNLSLSAISLSLYEDIARLAPYGTGNPRPVFSVTDGVVSSVKTFGKEKNHLEVVLSNDAVKNIKAIKFFKTPSDYGGKIAIGAKISMIGLIERDIFAGMRAVRLRIVDIE